jgi:hypothetical protein
MDDGSPRFQAARWVIRFGRLFWGVLVFAAAWSLLAVLFTWSPVALAVPLLIAIAGYATAWGALVRAFVAPRRGAWQLLVGLTAIGLLWPAGRPAAVRADRGLARGTRRPAGPAAAPRQPGVGGR